MSFICDKIEGDLIGYHSLLVPRPLWSSVWCLVEVRGFQQVRENNWITILSLSTCVGRFVYPPSSLHSMQNQVQLWTMSMLKWTFRMLPILYECRGTPFLRISGMEDHLDTMWVTNDWSRKEGRGTFIHWSQKWSFKNRGGSNQEEWVGPEGMKSVKHFIFACFPLSM